MEVNNAVKNRIGASSRGVRMALDRLQSLSSSGSDSFFSTYKHQACGTGDSERTSLPYSPLPDFSPQEEHLMSFLPWSAQLTDRTQDSVKSRNVPDGNNCGSEADLYGLVSNILEEADQMDTYFDEETSPHLKTVWSPKSTRGECQQYFQLEPRMQSHSEFLPNHVYPESVSKGQGQPMNRDSEEFYQQLNGFDTSEQQFLHSSWNGDIDNGYLHNQELPKPPGLSTPSAATAEMLKTRQSRRDVNSSEDQLWFSGSGNAPSGQMETFLSSICPQSKIMNSQSFDHYYEEHPGQSNTKSRSAKQYTMQEVSKLASNIQALMAGDQVTSSGREPQNRQSVQMQYDVIMAEQRNLSSANIHGQSTQAMQFKKELGGEYGAMQREFDGGMKSKLPARSDFGSKELTGFDPQNIEYFQPPKALLAPFNSQSSYFNKMAAQKGSTPASGLIFNQYSSNHHNQQHQLQDKVNQHQPRGNGPSSGPSKMLSYSVSEFVPQRSHQLQGGPATYIQDYSRGDGPGLHSNRAAGYPGGAGLCGLRGGASDDVFDVRLDGGRMHMVGMAADGCWDGKTGPQNVTRMRGGGNKDQGLLQNPYLDLLGSAYGSQRPGGGHGTVSPGKSPAFLPYAYQNAKSPGPNSCRVPLNFHPRSAIPYSGHAPTMDLCDLLPEREFGPFSPYLDDIMSSSGDNPYNGGLRSMRMIRNRGGPMSQLHFNLDECYEQWRVLEKERKKTEMLLTNSYPEKRISVMTSGGVPKIPPNPSRVDRLIVDQIREQAKVMSLLGKMERLRSFPLHANICSALDRHLEAIYITQARRKEEYVNTSNWQRQGGTNFGEERDVLLLATALGDLCLTTRRSRTALWCALQMTLPKSIADKPDGHQDTPGPCEDTSPGRTLAHF
ncbi:hypothetical protein DPEC_G00277770 [Dallia pectoralis]|uniref:Uncharacterized protein n=1 Tax=Dallia pectoralis TaxID=75939 RepID=A0ACC2FLW7_DALPE|nr:hypothetical protein DPEC_G00277770 [Dallia pectoralis]